MTVSLIVPLTSSSTERVRNWEWCRRRYEQFHPDWEIVTADDPGPGEWSKGRAVDAAVTNASGDVLVLADADLLINPEPLEHAVAVAETAPWVVPHSAVYRLTEHATQSLALNHDPRSVVVKQLPREQLARRLYQGPAGGGYVALTRAAYETVGGIDPRFLGWGGEDISFARALDTLIGAHVRVGAAVWHLHHPPLYGRRRAGSPASEALAVRYLDANREPDAMRALIAEPGGPKWTSNSTMQASPSS